MSSPDDRMSKLLTAREVAKRLGVCPWTVRIWLQNGTLRGTKLAGGHWRVHPASVAAIEESALTGTSGGEAA